MIWIKSCIMVSVILRYPDYNDLKQILTYSKEKLFGVF